MNDVALSPEDLGVLASIAETTLRTALAEQRRWRPDPCEFPASLRRPGAAFVTLKREARLLGCIGTMQPVEPLCSVVADRTIAAAFQDPRTRGVFPEDFAFLDIEVSVLTPLERFSMASYDELVAHAAVTREGLLVEAGRHRATFLPAVWDQLDDPTEFVEALWHKAGLSPRAWPADIELWRYSALKVCSAPPRPGLPSPFS